LAGSARRRLLPVTVVHRLHSQRQRVRHSVIQLAGARRTESVIVVVARRRPVMGSARAGSASLDDRESSSRAVGEIVMTNSAMPHVLSTRHDKAARPRPPCATLNWQLYLHTYTRTHTHRPTHSSFFLSSSSSSFSFFLYYYFIRADNGSKTRRKYYE